MSKMSEAHYDIARHLRWNLRELAGIEFRQRPEYEVDGSVLPYHRADGYRVVKVISDNNKLCIMASRLVQDLIPKHPRVMILVDVPRRTMDPKIFELEISIWNENPTTAS